MSLAYEKEDNLPQAITAMQVCIDYEREIGHSDAEKDAAALDALRAKVEGEQPALGHQGE